MSAYKLSGLAKVDGVNEFIETLAENGAKFIIFAHHLEVLNQIEQFCIKKDIGSIRIDGKVAPHHRHERVQAFQS